MKAADDRADKEDVEESPYNLPVDSEHKALKLKIFSIARAPPGPHMRSWHLCWIGFFISFTSTFAPAALLPYIRQTLNLDGIAAICGTLGARVIMGSVCDAIGPRLGMAFVLLMSSPCVFGMALADNAVGFALLRYGIGFGISTFVVRELGVANATAGGWGNSGGGVTQLLMPLLYNGLRNQHTEFIAWRWAMFVPGFLHILVGIAILFFSTDLPDGNYAELKKSGSKNSDGGPRVFLKAIENYRTWCLAAAYAFSFGIELTMNNIITTYIFDEFDKSGTVSGLVGSTFGLMNLFSRSCGGFASDIASKRFGMRGRLWALFLLQLCQGAFCIGLGLADNSFGGTVALIIIFSLFVQSCEGATYSIVPFVSKRSLGAVNGIVGAGGDFGSVLTQIIFFRFGDLETNMGIVYMGVMILAASVVVLPLYWPAWGGMIFPAKEDATEEAYYLVRSLVRFWGAHTLMNDYNDEEKAAGLADPAMKFAQESRSQRGSSSKALGSQASSVHDSKHDNKLYKEGTAGSGKGQSIADPVA